MSRILNRKSINIYGESDFYNVLSFKKNRSFHRSNTIKESMTVSMIDGDYFHWNKLNLRNISSQSEMTALSVDFRHNSRS